MLIPKFQILDRSHFVILLEETATRHLKRQQPNAAPVGSSDLRGFGNTIHHTFDPDKLKSDAGRSDGMKVAIMQPYFFPYISYFQLIESVDIFIIYDNIKYTKKGWINRNRLLKNGRDVMFTLPLKHASSTLQVCERELATDFDRDKLLNQIRGAYQRAPYFTQVFSLIERIMRYEQANLFHFLHHSIVRTCEHLGITTAIRSSSEIAIDHGLKSQDKVLALCEAVGARTYVNAIGGMELYSRQAFLKKGVELKFIKSKPFQYAQFGDAFVPWLSILDVMMFNPIDAIRACIATNYELI